MSDDAERPHDPGAHPEPQTIPESKPGAPEEAREVSAKTETSSEPPGPAAAEPAEPRRPPSASPPSELEKVSPAPRPAAARPPLLDRFREPEEVAMPVPLRALRRQSRRDFLLFGAGAAAAAAGFFWLLPRDTQDHVVPEDRRAWLDSLDARLGKQKFLNRALTFDDDVAEALYSKDRRVRTYRKSDITPLRNNYDGQTPSPDYVPRWTLTVEGLASGRPEVFSIGDLRMRFARIDQITRICCVEGWSAIAWWGGIRFADFLKAYPPAPGARWARLDSSVNLDADGNADPYYVSIDLPTAQHPQTLLATHQNDRPLSVAHGAPLRLLAPMKLGLKNIKAVTRITYSAAEPADYWNERGYSKYDGL
jgi:DMSO/TMAO reductase YedYZ molybdopterin-dependent catalytic subunit